MNIKEFLTLKVSDLDLGSGHTPYRRASLTDLYLHTKFHRNRKNFLRTDGRTYVRTYARTDGRTSEPHIDVIRSTLRSRPKNYNNIKSQTW